MNAPKIDQLRDAPYRNLTFNPKIGLDFGSITIKSGPSLEYYTNGTDFQLGVEDPSIFNWGFEFNVKM